MEGGNIFITVGSQKFQFNRLLKKLDEMSADREIAGELFAQTGFCDYVPQHFPYKPFLNRAEFEELTSRCDTVITHGGTGAIISAVKKEKRVIVVPRLAKYGEHVDDHQIQIMEQFAEMNLIYPCADTELLPDALKKAREHCFNHYVSNTSAIIDAIQSYIEQLP